MPGYPYGCPRCGATHDGDSPTQTVKCSVCAPRMDYAGMILTPVQGAQYGCRVCNNLVDITGGGPSETVRCLYCAVTMVYIAPSSSSSSSYPIVVSPSHFGESSGGLSLCPSGTTTAEPPRATTGNITVILWNDWFAQTVLERFVGFIKRRNPSAFDYRATNLTGLDAFLKSFAVSGRLVIRLVVLTHGGPGEFGIGPYRDSLKNPALNCGLKKGYTPASDFAKCLAQYCEAGVALTFLSCRVAADGGKMLAVIKSELDCVLVAANEVVSLTEANEGEWGAFTHGSIYRDFEDDQVPLDTMGRRFFTPADYGA